MKRKQFVKGVTQIAQEGAIQIFHEPNSGMEEVIVGAVGVLQFETLAGMCVMRPATLDEMLEVSGVGEHKLEKYGDRFLEILRKG